MVVSQRGAGRVCKKRKATSFKQQLAAKLTHGAACQTYDIELNTCSLQALIGKYIQESASRVFIFFTNPENSAFSAPGSTEPELPEAVRLRPGTSAGFTECVTHSIGGMMEMIKMNGK